MRGGQVELEFVERVLAKIEIMTGDGLGVWTGLEYGLGGLRLRGGGELVKEG